MTTDEEDEEEEEEECPSGTCTSNQMKTDIRRPDLEPRSTASVNKQPNQAWSEQSSNAPSTANAAAATASSRKRRRKRKAPEPKEQPILYSVRRSVPRGRFL